ARTPSAPGADDVPPAAAGRGSRGYEDLRVERCLGAPVPASTRRSSPSADPQSGVPVVSVREQSSAAGDVAEVVTSVEDRPRVREVRGLAVVGQAQPGRGVLATPRRGVDVAAAEAALRHERVAAPERADGVA